MSDDGVEPVSRAELGRAGQELEFLDLIWKGTPPLHAAYEVGWTPSQLRTRMKDRSFASAVSEAEEIRDEGIELALYNMAHGLKVAGEDGESVYEIAPDFRAVQWWLAHRRPEKWWGDKGGGGNTTVTISIEAKQMARDTIIATLTGDPEAIRALQPGGIIDAEVIDDDDADS